MKQGVIMAFDYGSRRTGVAVTDPMQTIASPLDTCLTPQIYAYLDTYTTQEKIAAFVVGYPTQKDGTPSPINTEINHFIDQLKKRYPTVAVYQHNERYTSKMAFQTLIEGGATQKQRRDKALVDKVSAAIILQAFMDSKIKTPL
jgi:putative Holliday junction resolvase